MCMCRRRMGKRWKCLSGKNVFLERLWAVLRIGQPFFIGCCITGFIFAFVYGDDDKGFLGEGSSSQRFGCRSYVKTG
jgi:hypothetical protein